MKLYPSLLRWSFRQLLPVTVVVLLVALFYALLNREPLFEEWFWPASLVVLHCVSMAICLGRFRSRDFGFLYSRGYSRDSLWAHAMLASLLAVLTVWLPVGLVVWLPVRSTVQAALLGNPLYPAMAGRELSWPFIWLALSGLAIPPIHYVWIRFAQPTRGQVDGLVVVMTLLGFMFRACQFRVPSPWYWCLPWGAGMAVSLTMLIAGFVLHRRLEVQS